MQPPLRNRVTMGFDPAYRTGCKIAVVDETGKVLETGVVYPTPPHNRKDEARKTLTAMIRRHRALPPSPSATERRPRSRRYLSPT